MKDILIKSLTKAAQTLEQNMQKESHIQDVAARLLEAANLHPHDLVIRSMEDIYAKKAAKTPGMLVSAQEFNSIRNSLWGLNPRTALDQYFPDLIYKASEQESQTRDHVYGDAASREISHDKTDAQIEQTARDLIVEQFKTAGVGYVQTKFAKGLYKDFDKFGRPVEGVLMFDAHIITKAGECVVSVPVVLDQQMVVPPDSFATAEMRYPLNRTGVSDFADGLPGLRLDDNFDRNYVFGNNEIRDIPTLDDTAERVVDSAKEQIYASFRDAGINNCQIRLASVIESEDGNGLVFAVKLPFLSDQVQVPVMLNEDDVLPPCNFRTASGAEYEISRFGLSSFLKNASTSDVLPSFARVSGEARHEAGNEESDHRHDIGVKLAADLKRFGAIGPQVYYVTSSTSETEETAAFIATFHSEKGACKVAVPVKIAGASVKRPKSFISENEQEYAFSSDGLRNYISAKTYTDESKPFYGVEIDNKVDHSELDRQIRHAPVTEGSIQSREVTSATDKFVRAIEQVRTKIAGTLSLLGAINPQVHFSRREARNADSVLHYEASFSSANGIRKAHVPVLVSDHGFTMPNRFYGEDSNLYTLSQEGIEQYVQASNVSDNEIEQDIASPLNKMAFTDLKRIVHKAFAVNDATRVIATMDIIRERYGDNAASNVFADLIEDAKSGDEDFTTKCGSCPFYKSKSDPKNHEAKDMCLKFRTRVASVKIGRTHKECAPGREVADSFDGSIMTSKIKFT